MIAELEKTCKTAMFMACLERHIKYISIKAFDKFCVVTFTNRFANFQEMYNLFT